MKGFLLGLLVAGLAVGGYELWKRQQPATTTPVVARADAGAAVAKKKKRRARGAARVAVARGGGDPTRGPAAPHAEPPPEPEPEPVRLSAADLKTVGQGDDLSRPDVVRMDFGESGSSHELSQDEIDERFRAEESAILDCIARARPDPETYVPGRVTVKFRIQRAGTVRGVRVEAPAVLQRGGLFTCVRGIVGRLKFPASGGSQIVTYPFTLS